MTEEQKTAADSAIAKLAELSPGEFVIFTASEAEALREVATWWLRAKGAFAIGGLIGSFAKWFLVCVAFFAAARAGLLDWIGIGVEK